MQNEITQCSAAYIIDFQQVNAGFQEVIRKATFVATKLLFVQIFSLLATKDTLGIVKIYKTDIKSRKCKQTLRCFFFLPTAFSKPHSHLHIFLCKALRRAKCSFILLRLRNIYANVATRLRFL